MEEMTPCLRSAFAVLHLGCANVYVHASSLAPVMSQYSKHYESHASTKMFTSKEKKSLSLMWLDTSCNRCVWNRRHRVLPLAVWSKRHLDNWRYLFHLESTQGLTHWGRDKMDAISQTTLSFLWIQMLEFLLKFHWSLFLGVQLTIFQHWFR